MKKLPWPSALSLMMIFIRYTIFILRKATTVYWCRTIMDLKTNINDRSINRWLKCKRKKENMHKKPFKISRIDNDQFVLSVRHHIYLNVVDFRKTWIEMIISAICMQLLYFNQFISPRWSSLALLLPSIYDLFCANISHIYYLSIWHWIPKK